MPRRSIELIDDGDQSAPSKRIINVLPDYANAKPMLDHKSPSFIGLPTLRQKCPISSAWITRLENL